MKIGIFDSGIGGLTILKELLNLKPNNHYIYYGDNINLPYGDKPKEELIKIGDKIVNYFINNSVDLVIIACGTMSSVIDKSKYNIKIIDIIEPVIGYLNDLNINGVALLGTTRTIEEGVFKSGLESLNIKVYDKACPKLPLIIEGKLDDNLDMILYEYLNDLKDNDFDYVVLGCTHFPLIEKEIVNYLNRPAINIGSIISDNISNNGESIVEVYFGRVDDKLKVNVRYIINYDIKEIDIYDISQSCLQNN